MIRVFLVIPVFILSFFIATALFDTVEKHIGYYDEGLRESAEVGK